jgi:Leucine-rich repeat (LRR) protein
LVGTLPFEISHLSNVVRLDLSNKDLVGPITNGIFSGMVLLREITFENNKFSGAIPDTFADENPLLDTLILAGNEFNSTLPISLTQLPLQVLELARNKITGPIPSEIGNLVEMSKCGLVAM